MKIDLKKYMNERDEMRASKKTPGPVITISRQYGCGGTDLAKKLVKEFSKEKKKRVKTVPWDIINKEILTLSAEDLKIIPRRIEKSVEATDANVVADLFSSLSPHYELSDKHIHQAVQDVIMDFAKRGHVIIIGRGGGGIVRSIAKSVRVKLVAPLEWRIQSVRDKRGISYEEAKQRIEEMDPKRNQWKMIFNKGKYGDEPYDLMYNRMHMTDGEIIDSIKSLCFRRELLVPF